MPDIVTESFKDFLQAIKTLPSPTTRSAKSKAPLIPQCIASDNWYWAIIGTVTPDSSGKRAFSVLRGQWGR